MKRNHYASIILLTGTLLLPAVALAEQEITNRLTLSARFGFNISAKFKSFGPGAPVPGPARTTPSQPGRPNGDAYNYDDGYVLTDASENFGGETWYWGYDSSASQIAGNTILLSRTTSGGDSSSGPLESEPYLGAELTYNRELGRQGNLHCGVEAAANYLDFGVCDNGSLWTRVTDAYPFTPGTTPPTATPPAPYQGSYEGPGFVIGDTPVNSTTTSIGQRRFDSDIWGFRLGPYLETPLCRRMNLSVSGGLAVGLLDNTVSWKQTAFVMRESDFCAVWGYYVRANVSWQFGKRWSAVGDLQYQDLGKYQHSFSGQEVELNLRNALFVTLGLSYRF